MDKSESSKQNQAFHDAAYDAFVTGLCFIRLVNYLGSQNGIELPVAPLNSLLDPYRNKLAIIRSDGCVNLTGDDRKFTISRKIINNFSCDGPF
jgi:poly(A)-specific ribonuclease